MNSWSEALTAVRAKHEALIEGGKKEVNGVRREQRLCAGTLGVSRGLFERSSVRKRSSLPSWTAARCQPANTQT